MRNRTRGFVMAGCGLIVLAAEVIDASNDGASVWNFVSIATGAFLLFYGFSVIARTGD